MKNDPNLKSFSRRRFLSTTAVAAGTMAMGKVSAIPAFAAPPNPAGRKPVVFATDIGGDIDDTWALGMLLKSPELEPKMVVTDFGNPHYRAKIIAKFLQTTGHGRIPVGIGPEYSGNKDKGGPQLGWIKDYDLDHYPGTVHQDGAKALADLIMSSPQPITIIATGPLPTVAAALEMQPKIAQRAHFVGMHGSVRIGYDGSSKISQEANVVAAVKPAQQVFKAPWDMTITPLDTCGLVTLDGERYQRLLKSKDPVVSAIIANYRIWSRAIDAKSDAAEHHSSVLFDTVAVYLAITHQLCNMEKLNIRVTDDGYTKIDPSGKAMDVATSWKSLDGYRDFLVNRLLANG